MTNALRFEVDGKVYYTSKVEVFKDKLPSVNILEKKENERKYPRKPYLMPVSFTSNDRLFNEFIKDISVGGVFIQTYHTFTMGQELVLSIPFSDGAQTVRVRGEIVRLTKEGIGVSFKRRSTLGGLSV